jgi:hypothetical protein
MVIRRPDTVVGPKLRQVSNEPVSVSNPVEDPADESLLATEGPASVSASAAGDDEPQPNARTPVRMQSVFRSMD